MLGGRQKARLDVSTPIRPEHADTALLILDACNPAGVLLAAHRIAAEVQHEHGTKAACTYEPLRLILFKLCEMAEVRTEYGDAWNHAYTACLDARSVPATA